MATSNIARIARRVIGKDARLFNDKLKDGTRSIKCWGVAKADYDVMRAAFEEAGHTVHTVKRSYWSARSSMDVTVTRLHVA